MDDAVGPDIRLLLVGINPGVRSTQVKRHFAESGNHFERIAVPPACAAR